MSLSRVDPRSVTTARANPRKHLAAVCYIAADEKGEAMWEEMAFIPHGEAEAAPAPSSSSPWTAITPRGRSGSRK